MTAVPAVRLDEKPHTVLLPDPPKHVALAQTDIAAVAREELWALSVAAGMAAMQAMFEAEVTQACGPKGTYNPERLAVRHGTGKGSITLGGRRIAVTRPRARTVDGHEVPLASYTHFAAEDMLSQVVMERMLAGVAARRRPSVDEPIGDQVNGARTGNLNRQSRAGLSSRPRPRCAN